VGVAGCVGEWVWVEVQLDGVWCMLKWV